MGAGKYPRLTKGDGAVKKAVVTMSKAMRAMAADRRAEAMDVVVSRAARNRAPRIKGAIAPFGGRKELKYVDTAIASTIDTTGAVVALNLIAVGDDNTSRDGRQVTIKSVQLKAYTQPVDTTCPVPQKIRVLLVWDNAVNSGALPTIAAILAAATPYAFPLIDNQQRFTILKDWSTATSGFDLTATATYSGVNATVNLEWYKRINTVTQYSGTTAAIGSIQNGGLYLVCIGSAATASAMGILGQVRVRFTDD